jgi:cytochrome c-type biogenesis protein CcmH
LRLIILIFFYIIFSISLVHSQEALKVNNIEAKELYEELRCLVCQNQSLLDSDAPLALDLKKLVLDKLEEGSSKEEIKEFLVERYGEFILLKPTFTIKNILLWTAPFIFVLFGFFSNFFISEKKNLPKRRNFYFIRS